MVTMTRSARHAVADPNEQFVSPSGLVHWRPLTQHLGARVTSHSASDVALVLQGDPECASVLFKELSSLLRERSLVLLRDGSGQLLEPWQVSDLYKGFSDAMGLRAMVLDARLKGAGNNQARLDTQESIQRAGFPGTPETVALGHSPEMLKDWHGLSGRLSIDGTENTFWERRTGNWHHDGGFSATTPPPPAIVSMYCERCPRRGGSVLRLGGPSDEGSVPFSPGATLFYSTRLALQMASPDLAARARRMTVVYGARGFAKIQVISWVFWFVARDTKSQTCCCCCCCCSCCCSLQRDIFPVLERECSYSVVITKRLHEGVAIKSISTLHHRS